jgi:hypothetical protein
MPSESNANKDLRHQQRKHQRREIIDEAIKHLGFKNEAEFAQKCNLNQGALNKILKGQTRLTDKSADILCTAIYEKNWDQGWSYSKCGSELKEAINYIWWNLEYIEKKEKPKRIEENDVLRWIERHNAILKKKLNTQTQSIDFVPNNPNFIIKQSELKENHKKIISVIKDWGMKYDFDLPHITQCTFKTNLPAIDNFIQQIIEQELYEPVREVFTEIKYIAHLCGAKDLVIKVSEWLIQHSQNRQDMPTEIMAKSMLAWSYTSYIEETYLNRAKDITDKAWNLLSDYNILSKIDPDVVAIFCELKLRIPIRLYLHQNQRLPVNQFEILKNQSDAMMSKLLDCCSLEKRLIDRFQIALKYQHGIYYFLIQEDKKAIKEFEDIANNADYIGWKRVAAGAYSWLGTLYEKKKDIEKCIKYWKKIDDNANCKRLDLRNSTYERIGTNFK